MEDQLLEQAKQVEKLYLEVVEDSLRLAGQEPIKIWLRPLKYPVEKTRAMMAWKETSDLMAETGSSEEDSNLAAFLALRLQTLFFATRKTQDEKSPRFFENLRQAGAVPGEEQQRLFDLYESSFEMTEEELGNSLRAKTNS